MLSGLLFSVACGGSSADDETTLPTTFGDCGGAAECEVALEAFTRDPNAVPFCPAQAADAVNDCSHGMLRTGKCGEATVAEWTYGMAGDAWRCVYDGSGKLVGAKWVTDKHPVQYAGEQPPNCSPSALPCAAP